MSGTDNGAAVGVQEDLVEVSAGGYDRPALVGVCVQVYEADQVERLAHGGGTRGEDVRARMDRRAVRADRVELLCARGVCGSCAGRPDRDPAWLLADLKLVFVTVERGDLGIHV